MTIKGFGGNDIIYGGGLNDTIYGGADTDTINGMGGNDTVYGEDGNDYITGGAGNDSLYGGAGNDSLTGSDGNDLLDGGAGSDTLYGGPGDDTYVWGQGSSWDVVHEMNGGGNDTIQFDLSHDSVEYSLSPYRYENGIFVRSKVGDDVLRVLGWFDGDQYKIEYFQFTDGTEPDPRPGGSPGTQYRPCGRRAR